MDATKRRALAGLLLCLVPPDGTPIGNQKLREQFLESARAKGHKLSDADFDSLHETLIEDGTLARGKGRGGSVRRVRPEDVAAFSLTQKSVPEPDKPKKAAKAKTATRGGSTKDGEPQVLSYRHAAKRKNNPQVGLVNETTDPPAPKTVWKRSGSGCLNNFPRFISGLRAGRKRCRVVHGGVRRLRRTRSRGGQLGAHRGFHLTRPAPSVAAPRGTCRSA